MSDEYTISPQLALALNLADYIKLSGKSQNQVAKEAGLASSTLSSYMTGARYPRPKQLQELARVLGTTISALTDGREAEVARQEVGSEDLAELVSVARGLGKQDREALIVFAKFLQSRAKRDE